MEVSQGSSATMTHPLERSKDLEQKDLDPNNNHKIMKDISPVDSVTAGKYLEVEKVQSETTGPVEIEKASVALTETCCNTLEGETVESSSDSNDSDFLMRFWDESEVVLKPSEHCKTMREETKQRVSEKSEVQTKESSQYTNCHMDLKSGLSSITGSCDGVVDLSNDLELSLKRSSTDLEDKVGEAAEGDYDGDDDYDDDDDDDDAASVASGTSRYVKSDQESEGGWITEDDDDLCSNGSGRDSETDFMDCIPKEVQVSSYPSPEFFRKRRSGFTSSLSFSSTSDEDDIDADPFMITGIAVPSGKNYAFPRAFLRDIEEVVDIWELDFQVNDQIVPSMESWERLRIVPSRQGAPDDYNRYLAYKILYSKWSECGHSHEKWYSQYLGMTLDEILNTRFERVKVYPSEPELSEKASKSQAEYNHDNTMEELLKLKMASQSKHWDSPFVCSSDSDNDEKLTSSEWCDSMDSTMTLMNMGNDSEKLDALSSEQLCDLDTEFDVAMVSDVTKLAQDWFLHQKNEECINSLPHNLTVPSKPIVKRQRSQSTSHLFKRQNSSQSCVTHAKNTSGLFQRQLSHSGVIPAQ